jgi:hypothetical protein
MSNIRKESIIIGILILLTFVLGILSIESYIDSDNYLREASLNALSVKISLTAQLVLSFIYIFISLLIYGILNRVNKSQSKWYLTFRIISQTFNIIGTIFIIALIVLSNEYLLKNSDLQFFSVIGQILKTARDYVNHILMITINCIAIIIFSFIALKYQLVHIWIVLLGFIGSALSIIASFLILFGIMNVISLPYLALNIPLALQDLFLALFLIFKGFNENYLSVK